MLVLFQNQTSLRYYLPAGRWYNYHTVRFSFNSAPVCM